MAFKLGQPKPEHWLRWPAMSKGLILTSLKTGITFIPFEMHNHSWTVVVVDPGPNESCQKSYPVGGYHIIVSDEEIATAIERKLEPQVECDRCGSLLPESATVLANSICGPFAAKLASGVCGPVPLCPVCADFHRAEVEQEVQGEA